MLRKLWFNQSSKVKSRKRQVPARYQPAFECLDDRLTPAVTAFFSAPTGLLTILGDGASNNIVVSRNAAGNLLINGGSIKIQGDQASVANTSLIQIYGQGGNDYLALDETLGALPSANIFGGAGKDTLIGGSSNDQLFGEAGNDSLIGAAGIDFLFGGSENDTLVGGEGNDLVFGQSGNDRMIWNPGDGTDLNEGGEGLDTVLINGGDGAEFFTISSNGARVRFDRLDPAPFSIDIGSSENLVLNANGGNDTITSVGNLAALIQLQLDGGAGNDSIIGSNGNDSIFGGEGNDFVSGEQGNDYVLLGAGDDVFQWDPGDGSDVVEGQDGHDTLNFNGSNANEIFDLSANGRRLRLTRNVANIVMDVSGTEYVRLNAMGGADNVTVNDLSRTGVVDVDLILGANDAQVDQVVLFTTNKSEHILINGQSGNVGVTGGPVVLTVRNAEANDALRINSAGGNDQIDASALAAGVIGLTIDAGVGNDSIVGSAGNDTILAGDGKDSVNAGAGNDLVLLGAGNDSFVWNPGDGSDIVDGQDGTDTLTFNGSASNETFDLAALGSSLRLFRSVGNIQMQIGGTEKINLLAGAGTDTIVVGDLSGTGVAEVNIDLGGTNGSPDDQQDQVVVNGTNGIDNLTIGQSGNKVRVLGGSVNVHIHKADPTQDQLTVNGLGGDDVVDASALKAGLIKLQINGGLGDDVIRGSKGDDVITGGDGNDHVFMGTGNDTFIWNPGDDNDVVEGQAGYDRLVFNGSNVSENFEISANGNRTRFFRNVANVIMDLNDVEGIDLNALGGSDVVVVNDLTGTDIVDLNFNLAGTNGQGDAAADTVILNATLTDDVIQVSGSSGNATVFGLAAMVNIRGSEYSNDRLVINSLAGHDVVEASALPTNIIQLTVDGGSGNDVIIGSGGADILLGGDGDDILLGGPGLDVLDGGPGDNIVIN